MANLITDYKGLQTLKRALNRFNNFLKNSDDEYCDISSQIKKILGCGSNLVQLLKIAQKYDSIIGCLQDCDTDSNSDDNNSDHHNRRSKNNCVREVAASDYFCLMSNLKNSQMLVLGLQNDLGCLINLVIKNFSTDCDILPSDEELKSLMKDLVCCAPCDKGDCDEFDRGYSVALVVFISLLFSGQFDCIKCTVCNEGENRGDLKNCNACGSCDPCSKCPRNLYELSAAGLQVLISLDNQDNMTRWFTIIGLSLGGIARKL